MKPSRLKRIFRLRNIILVLAVAAVLLGAALYLMRQSVTRFADTYVVYAAAETMYETAAYKPAVESNPVRAQVNQLLAEVLQVTMTQSERLDRANRGNAHLNDIELQIDAIKNEGDLVVPLLERLDESASSILSVRKRTEMQEIVSLGKRRAEIIADIRGLSYRANYYTGEVFERIIDDQGELTEDHVRHLNDLIPQLEEQFDARATLYDELQRTGNRMDQLARELGISQQIEE